MLTEGIDVSLDYNGVSAEVLDKILEKIMLISPKSSSSLFLISYTEDDIVKLF